MPKPRPKTVLILADIHYPQIHRPTLRCALQFAESNPIDGVVDIGDTFANDSISHWTKGKPGLRRDGEYALDTEGFKIDVLEPLEKALATSREKFGIVGQWKTRINGNHDDREEELYEEQPELRGVLDRSPMFTDYDWKIIPIGKVFRYGKLSFIHGETLGGANHAKRAVDTYCRNLVYGHFHTPQSFSKVLPQDQTQKWTATCMPIIGNVTPDYLKGRGSNWMNGFGVAEFHGDEKAFGLYSVIVTNNRCAYGGKIYEGGK